MKSATEIKDTLLSESFMQSNQLPLLLGTLIAKVDNLDVKMDDRFRQLDIKMEENREKYHKLSNDINTIQNKFLIDESIKENEKERYNKFRWYFGVSSTLLGIVVGDFLTRIFFHGG